MSFHWRLTPGIVTSTCATCGWTIRSTERDVLVQQRAHSWLSCQQRRAETTRVVEAERATAIPDEFCGKGHLRTPWNTRVDKAGDKRCSDCRRERRVTAKSLRRLRVSPTESTELEGRPWDNSGIKTAPITSRGLTAKTIEES